MNHSRDAVEALRQHFSDTLRQRVEDEVVAQFMQGVEERVREVVRTQTKDFVVKDIAEFLDHMNQRQEYHVRFVEPQKPGESNDE